MISRQVPVDYIQRTLDLYSSLGYPSYRWVENTEPPAWQPLGKLLGDCRVGLVASGGIYAQGQIAFHFKDDHSFRIIDTDTPMEKLRATHFAYDLTDARRDLNVVFPIDTLRNLATEGVIGELAPRAYTFMGGIYSVRRVRDELAPELSRRLLEDRVDLVLLVPV